MYQKTYAASLHSDILHFCFPKSLSAEKASQFTTMSLNLNVNNKQYDEWNEQSKLKLKEKILSNIQHRILSIEGTINSSLKHIISDIKLNNICRAITSAPNKDLIQYNNIIPLFRVSDTFVHTVTSELYPLLDKWEGVNVESMDILPDTFDKCHKQVSNYWNTNASEWLGDHLFYPLLNLVFNEFLPIIIQTIYANLTLQDDIKTEIRLTNELLKLSILKEILHAKVKFDGTKDQPLLLDQPVVLDQSFVKSKLLKQLIMKIGNENKLIWRVPQNRRV